LSLLALFTQFHIFWIAGLLLAYIDIPDFRALPMRISVALDRIDAKGGMALMGRGRQAGTVKTLLLQKPAPPVS
jgi:hypothetical protein